MKWKIGNVEIPNRFVLAPMAGVTDLAFRRLCKEQGAGLLCMEIISAKAISYKNKKTQKQKNLNKLLENQTNGLEDYMDLYMNYTSQSYGAVYEEYLINRCQYKQMLISIIILILFMIIGICANRSVQKSAAQKRQEQQQERYVDGLKKSVKVQKSNQ